MFEKLKTGNVELLKWIAIVFMIVDHTGHVFFKENIILHGIGRLAFPLFAYLLAHNYYFYSSDKKMFLKRLLLFGIISQPIYYFVISDHVLNIFFTLFLGLFFVFSFESILEKIKGKERWIGVFSLFIFVLILSLFVEYTFFGVGLIISFYFLFKKRDNLFLGLGIVFSYLSNLSSWVLGLSSFGSFALIYLIQKREFFVRRMNKWFFYLFYPVHLFILWLIEFSPK